MAEGLGPGVRIRVLEQYQDSSSSDEQLSDSVFSRSHHRHRTSAHRQSPPVMTTTSGALVTTASDASRRPSMSASIALPCQAVPPSRRHSVAVTASTRLQTSVVGEDREWRRRVDEQLMALQVSVRCLEEQRKKAELKYAAAQENAEKAAQPFLNTNNFSVVVAVVATVACAGLVGYCLGMSAGTK